MRTKIIVDLATGKRQELPFTAEEEAEWDRMAAEAPVPALQRDFIAEIDALTAKLARYEKTEAALIAKGIITSKDAEAPAVAKR